MVEPMNKLHAIILYAKVLEDNYLNFSEDTAYALEIIAEYNGLTYKEKGIAEKCAIRNVEEKLFVDNSTEMEVCADIEKFDKIRDVCKNHSFSLFYLEYNTLNLDLCVEASLEKIMKAKYAEKSDSEISVPTKLVRQLDVHEVAAFQGIDREVVAFQEIDRGTLQISKKGIIFKGKQSDVEITRENLGSCAIHERYDSCITVGKAGVSDPYVFKFASVDKAAQIDLEMSMKFHGTIGGYQHYLIAKHRWSHDPSIYELYDKAWRRARGYKTAEDFKLMAKLKEKYLPDILAEEDRYEWLKKELGTKKLKDKKPKKADSPELVNKIHSLILYASVFEDNYLNFSEDTIYFLNVIAKYKAISCEERGNAEYCAIRNVAKKLFVGSRTEDEVYADIEKFNKICKMCQYINDKTLSWYCGSLGERVIDSLRKIIKAKYVEASAHKISVPVKLERELNLYGRISFPKIDSGTLQISKEGIVFEGKKSDVEITREKLGYFELHELDHSRMVINKAGTQLSYVFKFDSEDVAEKIKCDINMTFHGIIGGYDYYLFKKHIDVCDLDLNLEELNEKAKQKVATEEEELKLIAELEEKYLPDNPTEDEFYKLEELYEWFKDNIKRECEDEEPEEDEPEDKKPEEEESVMDSGEAIVRIVWFLLMFGFVLWFWSLFVGAKTVCITMLCIVGWITFCSGTSFCASTIIFMIAFYVYHRF